MLLPLLLSLTATAPAVHSISPAPAPATDSILLGVPVLAEGNPTHAVVSPDSVGLRPDELARVQETLLSEVARGGFPGAALAVGRWEHPVLERGIGRLDWTLGSAAVEPDVSVYDLASLTKVVATTTAVMLLVEDGRIGLDTPVEQYLPEFTGGSKGYVTIRHLLTHTSGLPAGTSIGAPSPEESLLRAIRTPLVRGPGSDVEYSDIGFIVLAAAAERAAGEPLYRLLDRRVFGPLEMRSTTFTPGVWCERCAPTELRRDGTPYRGLVHDPLARQLGGVAGHAGLFSTAHDLGRFAAMLARGGELDGVRVLREETIRLFTERQPGAGTRALGWDTPSSRGGAAGLRISPRAFGHTGFTGTSLWVDPDRGTWTVLLSNRTFQPKASNRMQEVRRAVNDRVASAADGD